MENKYQGLTKAEVQTRIDNGQTNHFEDNLTRTTGQIIKDNFVTLFNILNISIAIALILVGKYKNILFLGVALSNAFIGTIQEIRSKRTIDKLSILAKRPVTVVREGSLVQVQSEEIVLDDIVQIKAGDQILTDGIVLSATGLEVDESLLTGEADNIYKNVDQQLMSGSFVVSGSGYYRVSAVGENAYAATLTQAAKQEKHKMSPLMKLLKDIIKYLSFFIVPFGAFLFISQLQQGYSLADSVVSMSAAMIGMIPEGLVLLTGVTFAVAAYNLAKYKTLVQTTPSIEMLARTDVLCLDKTGTITDGSLSYLKTVCHDAQQESHLHQVIATLMQVLEDDNPTALVLRKTFTDSYDWTVSEIIPFSSSRKYSGVVFAQHGQYLIGALEFLFPNQTTSLDDIAKQQAHLGHRVLAVAYSSDKAADLQLLGLIILTDNVRPEAIETFRYFKEQNVTIKVISGDNAQTVSSIAKQAKIDAAESFIDMSTVTDEDLTSIVKQYTVFGRVSPEQKKALVQALQQQGHTVCMTGDGVNDVLALKEADCSVAMVQGSQAARSVADFVLLTENFSAMIEVLKEGRRVINNIEKVSSLYLVKTIYATVLTIIFIFLPFQYPITPIQLSPVNALTVGIPTFFLALRANYEIPEGRFVRNVFEISIPAALTIIIAMISSVIVGNIFNYSYEHITTVNALVVMIIGFCLLLKVSQPFNNYIKLMLGLLAMGGILGFFPFSRIFNYVGLNFENMIFYVPILVISVILYHFFNETITKAFQWWSKYRQSKKDYH